MMRESWIKSKERDNVIEGTEVAFDSEVIEINEIKNNIENINELVKSYFG